MTECTECGRGTGIGAFYADDEALCRGCYAEGRRSPRVSGYVSPGQYERNAEAHDHAAVRHRRRVVENGVNQ